MNTNVPALASVYADLQDVLSKLQAINADDIESANLVPMVKAVQAIGTYSAAIDAQIRQRAVDQGELIPGVLVKDAVKHRQWNDEETVAALAQEQFGDKAFTRKLLSPAGIEKLGAEGKALVAIASYKPEGGKVAVY